MKLSMLTFNRCRHPESFKHSVVRPLIVVSDVLKYVISLSAVRTSVV